VQNPIKFVTPGEIKTIINRLPNKKSPGHDNITNLGVPSNYRDNIVLIINYNSVEGWHNSFNSMLSAHHSSIWTFITALKKEESLNRFRCTYNQEDSVKNKIIDFNGARYEQYLYTYVGLV